ncbi:hypothetical protein PFLUV_G00034830 [Perca fluviatilis]|uniref:Uncharacterized protein n=1 Tax=Perca fluviatilis TaxID=8168 RepID=A0A6A5FIT4_PERFL|nr:hypothetical protein PFLUV_G00034830 [Perca fluviatilis]
MLALPHYFCQMSFILHFYSSDEPEPQSEITLLTEASLSVKTVPCVIGQHAPWQWHRPGFGEKLSPLVVLWVPSGKLSWDLSLPAGWH